MSVAARSAVAAVAVLVVLAAAAACGAPAPLPGIRPVVLGQIAHDGSAFTEGLQLGPDGRSLYESTGLYGRSQLRELDPSTGALRRTVDLPGDLFGEGLAVVGDRIWQMTWKNGIAMEWDRGTFQKLREVPMDGEGWGLCFDGRRLVRSDGSDRLRFHDPATFAETGSVPVTMDDGSAVDQLNELECVGNQVWANVYQTDRLVRIDPATGRVTAVVDASGLLSDRQRSEGVDVLNGIAWLGRDEYLLTGKLWPAAFRVRLPS